jgi:hypothetical protein
VTSRLDAGQRPQLNTVVTRCRNLLAEDLGGLLEGRFGIRRDGTVESVSRLQLGEGDRAVRDEFEAILGHFATEGESGAAGRDRLVREAVFTHLNRLLTVRIAEELGLLPESIARGRDSAGFRDVVRDVAPQLGADETGGYWTYLCMCGDEMAADAPVLFDPRNPLLDLTPSPAALDHVIAELSPPYAGKAGDALWSAVDALGWAYQFFNSEDERRGMRVGGAPASSRELAVRNQFFTPDYVVHYLVHNTLGRRLVEADHESGLVDELDWLVDPPTSAGPPLDLGDAKVLDPACGSGHFLLGAYDVLEAAWRRRGVARADAAAHIVPALWGIDIDPRAVQVAAAAVVLRARRACGPTSALPPPNIICARALPPIPETMFNALPGSHRPLLVELREALDQAPVLGSLLRAEEALAAPRLPGVAQTAWKGMAPLTVADDGLEDMPAMRASVRDLLQRVADEATSNAPERLTAAEAQDALRFVDALTQRYDAVLMNPPFGEPVYSTRGYLKRAYPWIPTKDHNLFAAFVGRGLELCGEHGYLGAITSRTGMFLTTFEPWRYQVLLSGRLITLADLGSDVMEGANVEAAAYVLGAGAAVPDLPATFVRLLRTPADERSAGLGAALANARAGLDDKRIFRIAPREFAALAGSPLAYWISPSIRRLYRDQPRLEGNGAEVRVGLQTGHDFQFLRCFWEVDPRQIARSREETFGHRRWAPFAKGGEYSPFWADIHLVVDYERDGERLRMFDGAVVRNPQCYFRAGLTWPRRTKSGFGVRVLPAGCVFADKGPGIFPLLNAPEATLVLLKSRLGQVLIDSVVAAADETTSGGAARSYEVGLVQKLPTADFVPTGCAQTALAMTAEHRDDDHNDEATRSFIVPILPLAQTSIRLSVEQVYARTEERQLAALERWFSCERDLFRAAGLDAEAIAQIDELAGPNPAAYPADLDGAALPLKELLGAPIKSIIDLGIAAHGGSRAVTTLTYAVDRRLEVLAHVTRLHPKTIVEERRRLGILPPGTIREAAERLVSYLVGCAFGRWDVRIGRDPSRAPDLPGLFDPPPLCSPGMLVGPDGFPAETVADGYPLDLPPYRLLLDEPGHRWDMQAAVDRTAAVLVDDPSGLLHELEGLLDGRDLRDHLRNRFFRAHLGRYSKPGRKAPIYWPLYVPSKAWGVWVYAPTLTRETLFAVERAADQRLGAATTEIRRIEAEQLDSETRPSRELALRLESERKLSEELRVFHREVRRIADLGWAPDLDDGAVLCAAPLADLFPDWSKDLLAYRREIKGGLHPWAKVHDYRESM